MALIFFDGFDHYNTAAELLAKWDNVNEQTSIVTNGGRRGGGCARFNNGYSGYGIWKTLPTPGQTIIAGGAWNFGNNNINGLFSVIQFYCSSSSNTPQVALRLQSNGSIQVYSGAGDNGGGGSYLGATAPGVVYFNSVWIYIEAKVYCHATAGSVTIRINNQVVLSLTNVNTAAGYSSNLNISRVRFMNGAVSVCSLDDCYVCDNTGTVNNDLLGDIRVDALYPTAPGTHQQMLPPAPAAHAYWRVLINNVQTANTIPAIAEVAFHTTAGGAQAATGGTPISSGDDGTNTTGNAFDGNATTYWAAANNVLPVWIGYHFASAVNIVEFALTSNNSAGAAAMPTGMHLQYSDDGTTWNDFYLYAPSWSGTGQTQTFTAPQSSLNLINETYPDTTTLIYGTANGQQETFTTQPLPGAANGTIYGVQTLAYAQKDDTLSRSIIPLAITNGVLESGADTQLTYNSMAYYRMIFDQANGANWTRALVNAIEVGAQVGTQ